MTTIEKRYDQDKETARTIRTVATLICSGKPKDAMEYLEVEAIECDIHNGKDAARAFVTDVRHHAVALVSSMLGQ